MCKFTSEELNIEAERLFEKMKLLDYSKDECLAFAKFTLEINKLKKEKNAIILAHNYQLPEIILGVSDFNGDSYGLSVEAQKTKADLIIFCGVTFMAETAKILSPEKKVVVPSLEAGCSLADGITAKDVIELRKKFPNAGVVCYVNTTAEVKAESDVCCTSANALKVVESISQAEVIFIPDRFMAMNLQEKTNKKIHSWQAKCVVHETFTPEQIKKHKAEYPDLKVLAHLECKPEVIALSDLAGGTGDMLKYLKQSNDKNFLLVTECGMSDLVITMFPKKHFVRPCNICPYMKKISLENTLTALKEEKFEINLPKEAMDKARTCLVRMIEVGK